MKGKGQFDLGAKLLLSLLKSEERWSNREREAKRAGERQRMRKGVRGKKKRAENIIHNSLLLL